MRMHSIYELECVCGEVFEAKTTEAACPACGRLVELHWGETEEDADPS